jgi:hypothetical protein
MFKTFLFDNNTIFQSSIFAQMKFSAQIYGVGFEAEVQKGGGEGVAFPSTVGRGKGNGYG